MVTGFSVKGQMAPDKIRQWLGKSETVVLLTRVARSVETEANSRSLSTVFFVNDPFGVAAKNDLIDEIRSELSIFILENESLTKRIIASEGQNVHFLIKKAFLNHWISRIRNPESDPQRHLYKRTADLLRKSDDFHLSSRIKKGMSFSMEAENITIPPLVLEDMREIEFPLGVADGLCLEAINRKKVLIPLAEHFWRGVCRLWGDKSVWIDLMDFIVWIGSHVPISAPKARRSENDDEEFAQALPNPWTGPEEKLFDAGAIRKWARNFSSQLGEEEKTLFYLRHHDGLSFRAIAEKSGHKGASGPKYRMDRIEDMLKYFLRDLPWLSPDDLNRDAFSLFFETLLFDLKKERSVAVRKL